MARPLQATLKADDVDGAMKEEVHLRPKPFLINSLDTAWILGDLLV